MRCNDRHTTRLPRCLCNLPIRSAATAERAEIGISNQIPICGIQSDRGRTSQRAGYDEYVRQTYSRGGGLNSLCKLEERLAACTTTVACPAKTQAILGHQCIQSVPRALESGGRGESSPVRRNLEESFPHCDHRHRKSGTMARPRQRVDPVEDFTVLGLPGCVRVSPEKERNQVPRVDVEPARSG